MLGKAGFVGDVSNPGRGVVRFAVGFLVLVAGLRWVVSTEAADRMLNDPLCTLITRLSGVMLAPFGAVVVSGNRIGFDGFWVVVVEACNGVLPTTIYLAAVPAFPASWSARVWGVAIGIPAIFALNLVRVASLLVLGAYWPSAFEHVHIYVWQTLVVALSMAVWIFWAEYFVRPAARLGASA